jgi:sulfite exporter TauE/SafE
MTADWLVLGSALLSGLLGGVHCAAMCGGIATAFPAMGGATSLRAAFEPNLGRVAGYTLAGAIAGGLGHGIVSLARMPALGLALRAAVGLVLVIAALRLLDARGRLAFLGLPGRAGYRLLQPLQRRLLPADSSARRLLAGVVWGWLPCGLSATVLAVAWLQARALDGALTMLAFGLGTLPLMVPLTWSGARLGQRLQRGPWRTLAGVLVLLAGLMTLAAPWLAQVPAAHRALAALGCGSLLP